VLGDRSSHHNPTSAVTSHEHQLHRNDAAVVSGKQLRSRPANETSGAIGGLIAGGLWLWMAWANKHGRSWARILATVFFGVLTLYAAAGLVALPAAAKIVIIIEWAAGLAAVIFLWQRQSSDYYRAVTQPADHPPR
jgi:hypothetical protein